MTAALTVDLVVFDERWNTVPGLDRIEALADAAVRTLEHQEEGDEVVIALSTDDEVRGLNRSYRGKDAPTNVLSFPAVAGIETRSFGDVILAYETCAAEAEERGIELSDHACHLALHGILHLMGMDHEDAAEAVSMERLETRLLGAIGIADPHKYQDDDESEFDIDSEDE
jgi:probable rRNA maturation factor